MIKKLTKNEGGILNSSKILQIQTIRVYCKVVYTWTRRTREWVLTARSWFAITVTDIVAETIVKVTMQCRGDFSTTFL